ncbi:type I DNA topoisomerase [Psittacicella gerlachiana]|uniref:DNA topoisomerase 1 n=1 Tax=Psittacicella gerlachiana TaxID=2028574 RepID=A0A3A1YF80_9GAMM|nr:type I DNA topoisomerase [Psittacicella gerlachiana]RIY34884.1 DNA topoisomerase I [Psittacicella gerlachiana]
MSKSLVIVESPNKTATIKKYLNDDFIVLSSVGHIRDLPSNSSFAPVAKKGVKLSKEQKLENAVLKMGINPTNWDGDFQIMDTKRKVVTELKHVAKNCDVIYLATDLDREGEAIAWHLKEVLGENKVYKRVIFNEITKSAIQKAFANPIELNMDRVHAQQTRRYLDRIVGFLISPLLFKKAGRGLSAGRVQSVATRLTVEREREIRAFVPVEFWSINSFSSDFEFNLHSIDDKRLTSPTDKSAFFIPNQAQAQEHLDNIKSGKAVIKAIEVKDTTTAPRAPFTTSTLQQRASTVLGYDVRTTMSIAQFLYESGYITYMRTDSVNISQEARNMAKDYILENFGEEYWDGTRHYSSNNDNSQEAHEAIRPTSLNITLPTSSRGYKLYNLIKQQFLSSLMTNSVFQNTTISLEVDNKQKYLLRFSASLLKFSGHQKAFGRDPDTMVNIAKDFTIGQTLKLKDINGQQNFTSPPNRYTEASLVKELEKRSIGRPSTYASIISTIQERGYVTLENKKFMVQKIAEIVTDSLEVSFPEIMDYDFTAQMEKSLDEIANGEKEWTAELDEFWKEFQLKLIKAELPPEEGGMPNKELVPTKFECPTCHKNNMAIQFSKSGTFLTCMGYDHKGEDQCKRSLTLITAEEMLGAKAQDEELKSCPKCNSKLDEFFIDTKHKIYICSNVPHCDYTQVEEGNFIENKELDNFPCDKCGQPMELQFGPFGKYMRCTSCDNTRRILANGEVAPPRKEAIEFPELKCENGTSFFVLRNSAKGIFLGANNFPRCRETKLAPVSILAKYRDRLPEELHYLADGPQIDQEGNETVVRYSAKDKVQYLGSINKETNKYTKLRLDYIDGTWVSASEPEVKETKKKTVAKTKKTTTKKKSTKTI